jgi:hypothetical protein
MVGFQINQSGNLTGLLQWKSMVLFPLCPTYFIHFSPAALMLITINFSGTKAGEITFFSLDCAYKVCALEF